MDTQKGIILGQRMVHRSRGIASAPLAGICVSQTSSVSSNSPFLFAALAVRSGWEGHEAL